MNTMNDKLLTYRYPRTLAEASSRYLCDGEDARAIHGPYRRPLVSDDRIAIVAVIVCLIGIGVGFLRGVA
jgi:hypothetical protein